MAVLVPPPVVIVISTVLAAIAGDVAVIWLALLTVKLVAAVEPNLTAVAPVKPAPVMTTDVPPAIDPIFGVTEEITGGP